MEKILKDIVEKRKASLRKKGINFGITLPEKRKMPVAIPDFKKGAIICEIKRGSPSQGRMNDIEDPASWAEKYINSGAGAVSILTEEDYFFGSLNDLIKIKEKFPGTPVLRKDFLLSTDEIDISYRAGADMVLLIAGVLIDESCDISLIKSMKERAESLGMLPLIEIHNEKELKQILMLNPRLIGINSRDLATFKITRGYAFALKEMIESDAHVIFESGIRNSTDAFFVGSAGYSGILAGTSIVKSNDIKAKINEIKNGFIKGLNSRSKFFTSIFNKIYIQKKTAVKICGITNIEDAYFAVENGADIIGFVLADSPRKISMTKAKEISKAIGKKALKAVVVVDEYISEACEAVRQGFFDAVQFHGEISNGKALSYNVSWYKAVRVKSESDFNHEYFCPIVLYDAFSEKEAGGTGRQISRELLKHALDNNIELCLAGGINPENVKSIIENYKPLLVDASSGLEQSPGKKDHNKIKKFFEEIKK